MKIVFIHYHLKPGGVTTVIKQQAQSLDKTDVLIITGDRADSHLPFQTVTIDALKYDQEIDHHLPPQDTAAQIAKAIHQKWPEGCDLIHVHNPTLAKNRDFLNILKQLQQKGFRLLLQIHDFAEDGRPQSYFAAPYPSDCHYAVINQRDYNILVTAGLSETGLHQIPNSVTAIDPKTSDPGNTVVYPIRAIRRKNIGEAILLSLFFTNQERLAFTLPPNSPVDIAPYEDWKQFVLDNRLNVEFDIGLKAEFPQILADSSWVLTTSIMEGFGFSFLEPWLAGKQLWGRKLPAICQDFEQRGIRLKHLYAKIKIPLPWIGRDRLSSIWEKAIVRSCQQFDYSISQTELQTSFDSMTTGNLVDFGQLNETFQKEIIERLLLRPADYNVLISLNPFLSQPGPPEEGSKDRIQHNSKLIRENFNGDLYGKQLMEIYHQVISTPVKQQIDKKRLISSFLKLESLSLLKWGPYPG